MNQLAFDRDATAQAPLNLGIEFEKAARWRAERAWLTQRQAADDTAARMRAARIGTG
jgi:hypothetical protein